MNISGPAAVAKPEMLFYAPGDLTVTFEPPRRVYAQIMQDNSMRRKPYRVSEVKIRKIIATMPEFQ